MKFLKSQMTKTVFVSLLTTSVVLGVYFWITQTMSIEYNRDSLPFNYGAYTHKIANGENGATFDFTAAAETSIPAVVHIKTKFPKKILQQQMPQKRYRKNDFFDDFFDDFFGFGPQIIPEQQAAGSGVLISNDGYIVTNNHVITGPDGKVASDIEASLSNRQKFKARLIGNDPSSDLAVLKIESTKLPYLIYANSDNIQVGQWVLAVGYPLNLDATVTAGIVSAKSRTLGINGMNKQKTSPVESFIQTDAALNKGNSGGALVNLKGELIGINSAILSQTGYYLGYAFAIPSNIVKKIANDIIKYGQVQRGYLGISYKNILNNRNDSSNQSIEGIEINEVFNKGAAQEAGLKKGDVVTKINTIPILSGMELSSQLSFFRPGDKINITYKRNGKENTVSVVLKNNIGTVELNTKKSITHILGAEFEALSQKDAEKYKCTGGIFVKKINPNGLLSKTRVEQGFIIISIDGDPMNDVEDLIKYFEESKGSTVKIEGIYPNYDGIYAYPITIP
ncbi:MAG: trypsin-like peptidase domain-containing protein [Chitinophagaceae bacterium]